MGTGSQKDHRIGSARLEPFDAAVGFVDQVGCRLGQFIGPTVDDGPAASYPHNPIFTPSTDPDAWDCDGLLPPQVFAMNGTYYMIYAGLKGSGWNRVSAVQTGLAVVGV